MGLCCTGRYPHASILPVPSWATSIFLQGRDHGLLISVAYNFLCKAFPSFLPYLSAYLEPFCGLGEAWTKSRMPGEEVGVVFLIRCLVMP